MEKCYCYACGHLDTRPELHTTLEKLIASVRDKSIVPPKPNTRLEKYVAAMAGVWDDELPEPITREDKILFEAASGENVTLSGNPLILENCIGGKALKALHVYGKSTQDGTPSSDNPVPIVSAGDGGSVTVKVTGKNLFPVVTQTNLSSIIKPDGGIRYGYTFYIPAGSTVTITGNAAIDTNCFVGDFDTKTQKYTQKSLIISEKGEKKSTVLQSGWYVVYLATDYMPHIIEKLNAAKIQMEIGTESTAYSPYREQLLTLPTPNGLPGIPVTSGGNYTDPQGQQWVCDEVDLERGVTVQRVSAVDLSTCEITSTTEFAVTKRLSIRLLIHGHDYKTEALCNKLQFIVSFNKDIPHFYVDKTNVQAFIPIGAKNPEEGEYIVLYALATPVETPLTPAEIAAYKALTTYAPDTVVQATDGAGLEATYKCNVRKAEKTINDLYAELTAELEA